MRRQYRGNKHNSPSNSPPSARQVAQTGVHHILHLQRTIGNQATLRYIQRDPLDSDTESVPPMTAPISPQQNRENWDEVVSAELEQYLQEYMNIPVNVTYEEGGETKQTTVYVHPPYYMVAGADALPNTKKRHEAVRQNRKDASAVDKQAYNAASGSAKFGKARRHEIRHILETALANGSIPTPPGKKYPDSQHLRDWLVKYGISVDCSGFVGYAINRVMGHMNMMAGTEEAFDEFSGSGAQLTSRSNRLSALVTPSEMRPGTLQHMPGHIRIVLTAEQVGDEMIFTTAESTAGRGALFDEEGGESVKDVGPRRARWKYKDASKPFTKQSLYSDRGDGTWSRATSNPVYTRVKAMDEFQDSHQPLAEDFTMFDFDDEVGTLVTAAEEKIDEVNAKAGQQ